MRQQVPITSGQSTSPSLSLSHLEASPYILHTIRHNIPDIIFHTAHADDISSLSSHLSSKPEAVLPARFTLNSCNLDHYAASTAVYTSLLLLFAFRDLWKEWGDSNFQIFFSTELPVPPQAAGVVGTFNVLDIYPSEHYGLSFYF